MTNHPRIFEARVSTNCPQASVKEISSGVLKVRVKNKPLQGKANQEVVELLAKHFKVGESMVKIIRGANFNRKTIEIKE